jgi:hypothetical protein
MVEQRQDLPVPELLREINRRLSRALTARPG